MYCKTIPYFLIIAIFKNIRIRVINTDFYISDVSDDIIRINKYRFAYSDIVCVFYDLGLKIIVC